MNAVSRTELTPLAFLERSSKVFPERIAVASGTERLTYRELAEQATAVASAIRETDVVSGDRVAYLMPNVSQMLVAHFAVPLAGAVLVSINTRLSSAEVAYILDHSGARVLVVDRSLAALAADAVARLAERTLTVVVSGDAEPAETTPGSLDGWLSYEQWCADAPATEFAWTVANENAPIAINYTSGTTGRPKGVVYTHRGAYLNALGEIVHSGFDHESVYLWTLPMFHCNGWCTTWAVTAAGGEHVCLKEVRADSIWNEIRQRNVTHLNGAPTVLTLIATSSDAVELDDPITVTTAGAPPSPTILGAMSRLGFEVVHVYGLTETYGPFAVCQPQLTWRTAHPDALVRLKARQGVSMLQAGGLRVVDPRMQDVSRDGTTMGEIVMRGNSVMHGYFRDDEATEEAFRGGWFHSGDLGVMHADGYIELRDRAKDVIVSGGENISTVEVEQALASHPAVLEVAVVGVPDERWGERPKAFVVLRPEQEASEEQLIRHVRGAIARYKAPRNVAFVADLPKTSTGKVQKFALREAEWAGQASRIRG